jgi:hypothetical protein
MKHMLGKIYRVWSPSLRYTPKGTVGLCVSVRRPCWFRADSEPAWEITIEDEHGKCHTTVPELLEEIPNNGQLDTILGKYRLPNS